MIGKIKSLIITVLLLILVILVLEYLEVPRSVTILGSIIVVLILFRDFLLEKIINIFIDIFTYDTWKSSQRKLKKNGDINDETEIRISFAYLFRIMLDGNYFLVKSERTGLYHPVGGAYKLSDSETQYLGQEMSVRTDDYIPINETTRNDYRLLVKNKYLRKFVKRFDKRIVERENISELFREYNEEIFKSNILDKNKHGNLVYTYLGRHITNVEKTISGKYELLLADIVEINLSNNQIELFRNLMEVDNDKYMFASDSQIDTLGTIPGSNKLKNTIANHTFKIQVGNTEKLKKIRKYSGKYTKRL